MVAAARRRRQHTHTHTGSDSSDVMTNEPARHSRLLSPADGNFFPATAEVPPILAFPIIFLIITGALRLTLGRERKRVLFYDLPGVCELDSEQPNDLCGILMRSYCTILLLVEHKMTALDFYFHPYYLTLIRSAVTQYEQRKCF